MGIKKLILFMCGQLGIMLLARYFFQWLIDFYSQPVPNIDGGGALISVALVGVVLLAFRVFDGVTDPIAGTLSDLWVRSGRERRSLLWYTAPLPAIGLVLCFLPNIDHSSALRWFILVTGFFIFFIGYTLYAIPYWSLVGDYTKGKEKERGHLSTALGVGMLLATTVGFVLTPILIEQYGYLNSALFISVLSVPLMIAPYFGAPQDLSSNVEEEKTADESEPQNIAAQMKMVFEVLKNKRFMSIICLFAGSQMSFTVMTSAAPFIATDLLGGQKSDIAFILGPLLFVAIPSSAFLPRFTQKVGWEKGITLACMGLACVYLGVIGLGINLVVSPLVTASILFALGGPMTAVLLGLEGEAITACAEEADGGVGQYFGVYNLVVKGANGLAIALTALLAEWARGGATWVVKLMGVSAGLTLILGLIMYVYLRPNSKP